MRIFSSIVASLFLSSTALADTAISLPPMKGDKTLDVVATKNFTGSLRHVNSAGFGGY